MLNNRYLKRMIKDLIKDVSKVHDSATSVLIEIQDAAVASEDDAKQLRQVVDDLEAVKLVFSDFVQKIE